MATTTKRDIDRLERVAWGENVWGSLLTSRQFPRRDMLRLVEKGFVRSVGMAIVCDDDGFHVEPERYREGFALTEAGREALAAHSDDHRPGGDRG